MVVALCNSCTYSQPRANTQLNIIFAAPEILLFSAAKHISKQTFFQRLLRLLHPRKQLFHLRQLILYCASAEYPNQLPINKQRTLPFVDELSSSLKLTNMVGRPRRASTSSVDTVDNNRVSWRQEKSVIRYEPGPIDPEKCFELRDAVVLNKDGHTLENALDVASRGPYTIRGTLMIDHDQKHHR